MVVERPAPIETAPLVRRDVPVPEPGPGQIRIRVAVCGVCHTDLHVAEGDLPLHGRAVIPGHQVVGTVDAAGPGAKDFQQGARVGVPWLHRACGACRYCRSSLENLCPDARFTGYHEPGGFAEFMLADEAFAYPIPPGFPDREAAPLLCAGIIGYRSLRVSGIQPGGTLGLYGFGASAHIALQIARHWGCAVYVFTRSEEHRALARRLGAAWAGGAEEDPGRPMQAGIIFAPAGGLVPRALEQLDRGGTVALAGIWMSGIPPLDYERHLYQEKALRSVTASTRQDARELLALAAAIPVRTDVQEFPLEQANEALRRLKHSRLERGAAVLVI
jgi:propanol-preferring alcohol dehydrogenase